ncbi:MAG TPA: NUDIX domain-containing protein [Ochrobactrum sp.]|nr:NUDIX domain-containing protein [Ochrobactrum sp.]
MTERERHMQSAAVFMILRKNTQVLLLQRKATGWMDGQFSVPAGALDAGETVQAAAIREALEEVGVTIQTLNTRYAHTMHCKTGSAVWMGHFFTASEWLGEPHLCEPDKHSKTKWCEITSLPENLIPYVKQALEMIERDVAYSEFGWGG